MSRSITVEDLYEIIFLSRPRISPDGERVAYVATEIDKRTHSYRSAIWVTPANGGEARRVTAESSNATDPSWSPDGKFLAFLSERAGKANQAPQREQRALGKDKAQ